MNWRVIWIPQLLGAVMSGIFVFRLGTGTVPRTVLHSCEEIAGMIRQNRNCENWIAKTENHLRRNGAKFHYGEKITPVKYLLIRLLIAFAGSLALGTVGWGYALLAAVTQMKKTKEIVLYDDTENYKKFDETRDFLFEVYADENGWACKENIPDETVYKEIDFQNQETWRDLKDALENSFKTRYYLMTGTCGRWNGNFDGGTFITCYRDFQSMIQHLDNIKVIDRNGHLIIEGYHHDGSDRYELKRLTRQGYEYADRNYFAHDRKLHSTIMNCNFFSALPRLAKRVYGL